MVTIKSFTSLEQSKKLAEILPLESADMAYIKHSSSDNPTWEFNEDFPPMILGNVPINEMTVEALPCWSLAALLEQLHYEVCDDDGYSTYLQINKDDDMYQLIYEDPYGDFKNIETDRYEHFVDACVAMIEKLHELKML
jgi:hypothetical protein